MSQFKKNEYKSKDCKRFGNHNQPNTGETKLSLHSKNRGTLGFGTNFHRWFRSYGIKMGTYGEDILRQFQRGEAVQYDLQANLANYPLQTEKEEQLDMLEQMNAANVKSKNDRDKNENTIATEQAKKCVEKAPKTKDIAAKVFAEVLTSMSDESQKLVKEWKSLNTQEGQDEPDVYTFTDAENDLNWWHLFKAARETHEKKLSGEDEVGLARRQESELQYLKTLYHKLGLFTAWMQNFEDQVDCVEAAGREITDSEKRIIFMNNLNKEIFVAARADWTSLRHRAVFPVDFESLETKIVEEYEGGLETNPELVRCIERGQREEQSFKATSKGDDKSNKGANKPKGNAWCAICEGEHYTDSCRWRNKRYDIMDNIRYQKKMGIHEDGKEEGKSKSNSKASGATTSEPQNDPKWNPTKGTIVNNPPNVPTKQSNHVVELRYSEEEIFSRTILSDEDLEVTYRTRITASDEIVFICDTGSESGSILPKHIDAVRNIHESPTWIVGQGGAKQLSKEAGSNTFGLFRKVCGAHDNKNLISWAESEKIWQLFHPRPGYLQLREWPWAKKQVRCGTCTQILRYGAILSQDLSSAGCESTRFAFVRSLETDILPDDANSTSATKERVEMVENIHIKTGHTSALGLLRIINSENASVQPVNSRLGITAEDIKIWDKQKWMYCSGCLQGKMTDHNRVRSSRVKDGVGKVIAGI